MKSGSMPLTFLGNSHIVHTPTVKDFLIFFNRGCMDFKHIAKWKAFKVQWASEYPGFKHCENKVNIDTLTLDDLWEQDPGCVLMKKATFFRTFANIYDRIKGSESHASNLIILIFQHITSDQNICFVLPTLFEIYASYSEIIRGTQIVT